MALDFLPNLPKADLDDRSYSDLLQECLLRIPRYCPEWTNYNPSEPGVTLLESFAWLTDQMLMRFNQVPRRHYVAFLELLGIRLQAPQPATTQLTFYLVSELPDTYRIPAGVQVATERTAQDEAIVFSTDRTLEIGQPRVRHLLSAATVESPPTVLRDRFNNYWNRSQNGQWTGPELSVFNEQPAPNNCFYLVLDEVGATLNGNVVALTFQGQAATPTGINPSQPPRRWEAWDGNSWQPVLLNETDDQTQGLSFAALVEQGGNPMQGADLVLHLPPALPVTQFANYRGHWLRCLCTEPTVGQAAYSRSPRITGVSVRAIGGTVLASQCELIETEVLGESDGSPNQTFELQARPVLARQSQESVIVTPPNQPPEVWEEVTDFSGSGPSDRHYAIDSITGVVQFGPRVREPSQLRQRSELQTRFLARSSGRMPGTDTGSGSEANPLVVQQIVSPDMSRTALMNSADKMNRGDLSFNTLEMEVRSLSQLERQYGAIPPKGATITMSRYRTGGGQQGNVNAQMLTTLKSAVPYVGTVTNHSPARHGADAESLEQAAIRVPQLLRTNNRAVTPEDFESLALQGGKGAIARAHCLPPEQPGLVPLMLIPQVDQNLIQQGRGLAPDLFMLTPTLQQQVRSFLDRRRLLGTQIEYRTPDYVGVTVQTEIALNPNWHDLDARSQIIQQLQQLLYHFLNPVTGGRAQKGWPLGQSLYQSDIVSLLQGHPGIQYLGAVQLFQWQKEGNRWHRRPPTPRIDLGHHGVICSWHDAEINTSHRISVIGV